MSPDEAIALPIILAAAAALIAWAVREVIERAIIVRLQGHVEDHVACENPDCTATICCCNRGRCRGTVELGCSHHNALCVADRWDCAECREEDREDRWIDAWREIWPRADR